MQLLRDVPLNICFIYFTVVQIRENGLIKQSGQLVTMVVLAILRHSSHLFLNSLDRSVKWRGIFSANVLNYYILLTVDC